MRTRKIYLNTPISDLSRKEIVRIGGMATTWCKRQMGINRRKSYLPQVHFSRWAQDGNICGEYDDETNEIFVFYRNCDDVREMLSTILHEWQHQLQPLRTQYFKFRGPYRDNPFEVEAREAERVNLRPLWEGIKGRVNRVYC